MKAYLLSLCVSLFVITSCTNHEHGKNGSDTKPSAKKLIPRKQKKTVVRKKPLSVVQYHLMYSEKWMIKHKDEKALLHLIATINRTDTAHLNNRNILIPNDSSADIAYYMPFPFFIKAIKNIDKIIFFSYPAQAFGAYENGELVYTGATNMGRQNNPTPTGLFFTNWKAEETTSSFNDEWNLRWNFNVENKLGVGWHQYDMPGYPASHSCMRLQEVDAKYLYHWADQWVLQNDTIQFKGTPVIIFGRYHFKAGKPWQKLAKDPHALDIKEVDLQKEVQPYLKTIEEEQNKKKQNQ